MSLLGELKRRNVIALAIGFGPVLIATWVFELTPEGWVRDSGATSVATPSSNKRFDRIVVAMLLVAVAVFATHTFILDPARDAAERDPLNTHVAWNLSRAYRNNRQFDRAEQVMRKYQALNPDAMTPPWRIGLLQLLQSRPEAALRQFVDKVPTAALQLHGKTLALHELGRTEEAAAALAELVELEVDGILRWRKPFLVATAYAWTGDNDNAFAYLEKQRELESGVFRVTANGPLYENLKDDLRWAPFLESVELAPERLAAIEFNPTLPPGVKFRHRDQ